MSDFVVHLENLSKFFGRVQAVNKASFSVKRGSITAFLGENGAGKTTTLKTILGFLKPDSGNIEIKSKKLGYVPEHPVFFPWLKGWNILEYTAKLSNINRDYLSKMVENISFKIGFDPSILGRRIQTYSLGNQKKFSYLQNLILSPDFLIVDEPFSSLDPVSIKKVRELFVEFRNEQKTLLLSSHLISEMEKICDNVIIIKKGCVLLEDSLDRLRSEGRLDLEALFLSY